MRLPKYLVDALDDQERQQLSVFTDGVYPVDNGFYGLARAGYDFIRQFGAYLQFNEWIKVPGEPVLMVYWQVEDEHVLMRKALRAKAYVDAEWQKGRNILDEIASKGCEEIQANGVRRFQDESMLKSQ